MQETQTIELVDENKVEYARQFAEAAEENSGYEIGVDRSEPGTDKTVMELREIANVPEGSIIVGPKMKRPGNLTVTIEVKPISFEKVWQSDEFKKQIKKMLKGPMHRIVAASRAFPTGTIRRHIDMAENVERRRANRILFGSSFRSLATCMPSRRRLVT